MSARPLIPSVIGLAMGAALLALVLLTPGPASAGEFCRNVPAEGGEAEACVILTPDTATNPVGTDHTLTAVGSLGGEPPATPVTLLFYVVAGPNTGDSLVFDLDEAGEASFTYTGDGGPGDDSIITLACDPDTCLEIQGCLDKDSGCLAEVESSCDPTSQGTAEPRVAAGGDGGNSFCFGPATATKTWVDPTPTPSPTPNDVGAGGQAPSPTPAQLPQSGGDPGGSDSPGLLGLGLITAAAIAVSGGAVALARRATR